jgi:hypothetical protein
MNLVEQYEDARRNTRSDRYDACHYWLGQWRGIADTLMREYLEEYRAAQEYAAIQIWGSIQRHAGDPRWEWKYQSPQNGDFLT